MLEYMFSHSFFGLCAWDLPALIVLIAMIVVFAVHRHNMKKREKDFEDETGLSRECCELYGKLYEEHFSELRLNLILYGLNECQTQLLKIQDFM